MTGKQLAMAGLLALAACFLVFTGRAYGGGPQGRVVRIAELEIDPGQLAVYRAALKAEIEASIRLEPGVLALYAVAVKDHPEQVRLFEMYSSPAAYEAHLQSAHFKRYKAQTQTMVRSLKLVETEPVMLGSK